MSYCMHVATIAFLLLGSGVLAPAPRPVRAERAQPLVVIVSATKTKLSSISTVLLRRVFTGYPTDDALGHRLIPLNWPLDTPERVQFDQVVLGMTRQEVALFWVDQRIRGVNRAPRTVPTPQLALRAVAALPGGITYVPRALANAAVRVLDIDGKSPSDPGYLLAPR